MNRASPKFLSLLLLWVGAIVGLGICEIALRLTGRPRGREVGWRALKVHPGERNSCGFRGQPIEYSDGDFVVLLLGDSQVEAQSCAHDRMPERRLESHLGALGKRVRVFSLGASGYGQDQQLLVLQEYFERYPADLVISWLTPSNDVVDNVFSTGPLLRGRFKPTFWLEGEELRGPNRRMGDVVARRSRVVGVVERLFGRPNGLGWVERLPPAYAPMHEYTGPTETSWQVRWDRFLDLYGHADMADAQIGLSLRLIPNSERMRYGLKLTQRLLDEIARTARRSRARFVLFWTSGTEEDLKPTGSVQVINGKFYRESHPQLLANLEQLGAPFETIVVPVTLPDWRVGPDDSHLNQDAVDQVMRDLAIQLAPLVAPP